MAEVEPKKVEPETTSSVPPPSLPAPATKTTTDELPAPVAALPPPPGAVEKAEDSKALSVVEKSSEVVPEKAVEEKPLEGSINRDAVLARVATTKRESLIKAWQETEGSKAENKAQKKLAAISAWENSKKAAIEAELRQIEEKLEKKKAVQVEKLKNNIAILHKTAEEKRAGIEAKRGEDLLKVEEMAAKYQATGTGPKKILGLF
jgi:hypothetical protein